MLKQIASPFEKLINSSALGSFLLLFATVAALVWANSPFSESYKHLWEMKLSLGFEDTPYNLSKTLHHWINDGLMAIFFLYVGLEIKREVLAGELKTFTKAALPIFAAVGGVVIPLSIFFILNGGGEGSDGWGVPLATDIAFTLGILQLLGDRVPLGLKVFLTAFAIVDDIIAVLIIAIFYSGNISWMYLGIAGGLLLILGILGRKKYYSTLIWFVIGIVIWFMFLKSGVHATIAGVLIAMTIPSKRNSKLANFFDNIESSINTLTNKENKLQQKNVLMSEEVHASERLRKLGSKVIPPMQRVEHRLEDYVSYLIMPLFALANAGIIIKASSIGENIPIIYQIGVALIVGKAIGISLFSWIAVKTNIAKLPQNVNFTQIIGIAVLGGLGFTMSIFIANLAFDDEALLTAAKFSILITSFIAGLTGFLIVRFSSKKGQAKNDPEEDIMGEEE
ncbi:Na+/H+ antiporter NhaA [Gangjinia marincola]|uniref:Na(+)/H(+) antiporter NhaA n=1 Tax=Gangjinia marincola TaxID=578463 RepID=A0ABN1MHE6_9FLAO